MAGPRTSSNTADGDVPERDDLAELVASLEELELLRARATGTRSRTKELPTWARFPRVDGATDGPVFGPEDARNPEAPAAQSSDAGWDETELVLSELDRLHEDVRGSGGSSPGPPQPTPPKADAPVREPIPPATSGRHPEARKTPEQADFWASPNSYLEERLRLANSAAAELGEDVRAIAETWSRVQRSMGVLEEQVERANLEMEYIRGEAQETEAEPRALPREPIPASRSSGIGTRSSRSAVPMMTPGAAPYGAYTADRYNETIGSLKARRRRLAGWTFVTAGLISLALVTITVLVREPTPPLWLAILPAVWMIPVPFFVLSFRGTQRVLRHNHLEVPGGSP